MNRTRENARGGVQKRASGRGDIRVAGHPRECPESRFWRFSGHRRERASPQSPGTRRNPASGVAPGRGVARPGGVPTGRGVPAAADQPDHPAAILRPGRASRRKKFRSARAGILSRRLSSPHPPGRDRGMAGAESNLPAPRLGWITPVQVSACAAPVSPGAARTGFGDRIQDESLVLRLPRARVFAFCPASPPAQRGALPPGALRTPPSWRRLRRGPLAGRLRAVRGARRGWVGWPWRCRFVGVCRGCCFFLRGASWGFAAVGRRAVAAGGRVGVVRGRAPLAVAPVGAVVLRRGGGGGVRVVRRRRGVRRRLVGLVWLPGGGAAVRRSRRSALWRVGAGRPGAVRGGRAGGVASGGGVGGGRLSLAGRAVFPGRLALAEPLPSLADCAAPGGADGFFRPIARTATIHATFQAVTSILTPIVFRSTPWAISPNA